MIAPVIWLAATGLLVYGLFWLWGLQNVPEWQRTILILLYVGAIWTVITKV